jgi:hypothetical protein
VNTTLWRPGSSSAIGEPLRPPGCGADLQLHHEPLDVMAF